MQWKLLCGMFFCRNYCDFSHASSFLWADLVALTIDTRLIMSTEHTYYRSTTYCLIVLTPLLCCQTTVCIRALLKYGTFSILLSLLLPTKLSWYFAHIQVAVAYTTTATGSSSRHRNGRHYNLLLNVQYLPENDRAYRYILKFTMKIVFFPLIELKIVAFFVLWNWQVCFHTL